MITTATMAVTTPSQIPPNEVTFTITNPTSPLFLGTLKINGLPSGAGGVLGSVDPGGADASHPASHTFKMGSQFQSIRQFLINNQGPLSIQITYDTNTFLATNLNVIAMLMAANG
ncbi:MAG TPA: hypothetical protein VER96_37210 [Polyangiaceae bacterium]|nr:hypothetical protein [Polyangiaceae bacterium]